MRLVELTPAAGVESRDPSHDVRKPTSTGLQDIAAQQTVDAGQVPNQSAVGLHLLRQDLRSRPHSVGPVRSDAPDRVTRY